MVLAAGVGLGSVERERELVLALALEVKPLLESVLVQVQIMSVELKSGLDCDSPLIFLTF